jgi:glycosyltransferase involved in cell wall biosynthesis
MEKMLSIILPVYNVEQYLERCIRSLEDQDILRDLYEVIVVNDGSPDNSRDVVLRLMNEFSNIILIEQENKGVSMARNAGIEKASGKYLLFVDPDDYVVPNFFKRIIGIAVGTHAQVMYLGYRFLNEAGLPVAEILNQHLSADIYVGHDAYFLTRSKGFPDPDRSWSILFDRKFIIDNNLYYLAQVPYLEDGEFIARVLCMATRCKFFDQPFYMRTTRPGSATNSNLFYQERSIDGFIKAAGNLKDFRGLRNDDKQLKFLNHGIAKFTLLSVQACVSRKSFHLFKPTRMKLKFNELTKLQVKGCRGIYYYYGVLYNLSVWVLFIFLYIRALHHKTSRAFI